MTGLDRCLEALRTGVQGQTMVEYALILAAIFAVLVGLYGTLGGQTANFVKTVVDLL